MKDRHPTEDTREQAVLHALGALDAREARAFEVHLERGCEACEEELRSFREVTASLGFLAQPVQPRAELRALLLRQIQQESRRSIEPPSKIERHLEVPTGITFAPASEGEWAEVAPGIALKVLFTSPQHARTTALVRMAPGSRYGPHRHVEAEEFFVLEGSCVCSGQLLRVGDYRRAEMGTIDSEDTYTVDGCVMLLIASLRNEMLEGP